MSVPSTADVLIRAESALVQSEKVVKRCRELQQERIRLYVDGTDLRISLERSLKGLDGNWPCVFSSVGH